MKLNKLITLLDQLAPLKFAEEWDNVGLILSPLQSRDVKRAFLTIDLTERVADEAIAAGADVIISYHPIIFRGIQRLDPGVPADRTVMKLVQNNVAVYSPHTALDTAPDGTNDWLAKIVGAGTVSILNPNASDPAYGQGRLVQLDESVSVAEMVARIKTNLNLETVRFAGDAKKMIRSVALCAGAGTSVIGGVDADLYLTGEMSHHYALAAAQDGRCVILCEHTNTERGYLPVLKARILESADLEILISEVDRDPLTVR